MQKKLTDQKKLKTTENKMHYFQRSNKMFTDFLREIMEAKENGIKSLKCWKILNSTHHQENANENYNEISPHTCQNGYNQKHKKTAGVGEDVE